MKSKIVIFLLLTTISAIADKKPEILSSEQECEQLKQSVKAKNLPHELSAWYKEAEKRFCGDAEAMKLLDRLNDCLDDEKLQDKAEEKCGGQEKDQSDDESCKDIVSSISCEVDLMGDECGGPKIKATYAFLQEQFVYMSDPECKEEILEALKKAQGGSTGKGEEEA